MSGQGDCSALEDFLSRGQEGSSGGPNMPSAPFSNLFLPLLSGSHTETQLMQG